MTDLTDQQAWDLWAAPPALSVRVGFGIDQLDRFAEWRAANPKAVVTPLFKACWFDEWWPQSLVTVPTETDMVEFMVSFSDYVVTDELANAPGLAVGRRGRW